MIVEYIRYTIADDKAQAFDGAYAQAVRSLDASAHCLGYELTRCLEDTTQYVLRIVWDSLEGHMQGFRGSQQFREFLPHIRAFVDDIEEMRHYEVILSGRAKDMSR